MTEGQHIATVRDDKIAFQIAAARRPDARAPVAAGDGRDRTDARRSPGRARGGDGAAARPASHHGRRHPQPARRGRGAARGRVQQQRRGRGARPGRRPRADRAGHARRRGPGRRADRHHRRRRLLPAPRHPRAPRRRRSQEGARDPHHRRTARESAGRLAKIYPQIENGRVIADVEVDGLGDCFVDARMLVEVPVGERDALLVPRAAVETRSGIDFVTLREGEADDRRAPSCSARALPDGDLRRDPDRPRAGDVVVTAMTLAAPRARGRADPRLHHLAADAAVPAGGPRLRARRADHAAARGGAADLRADGRHPRPRRRPEGRGRGRSWSPSRSRRSSRASTASSTSTPRPQDDRRDGHRALPGRHHADAAILRVHEKIRANIDRIPVGIPEPLIVGRGIDDVAIVVAHAVAEARGRRPLDGEGPDAPRPRAAAPSSPRSTMSA